jgi:polygalacturonase
MPRDVINVREVGAAGDGRTDDTAALQSSFDEARRTGRAVFLPQGDYTYTSQLRIEGIQVFGVGPRTRLMAQIPTQQRVLVTGEGPVLACLQIMYHDLERSGSDHGRKGVMVQNAHNFLVRGLTLNGQGFSRTPKYGGGALFIYHSSHGKILNNHLLYTAADAIHITGGSQNIAVEGNRIEFAGDDGIAVVNYGEAVRNRILIKNNTILNNRWGRNISAVGGQDVQISGNDIMGNTADGAGIYIASEPAYDTAGPSNILVQDNTLQNTGGPDKGHGQIMLWNGNDKSISDVQIRNNRIQASKRGDLAIVVSNTVRDVILEGNSADGITTLRGGASIRETSAKLVTTDGSIDFPAPPASDASDQCSAVTGRQP